MRRKMIPRPKALPKKRRKHKAKEMRKSLPRRLEKALAT
jgi:hypothetical protein